ncbi:MAG: TlpA disulfide reductase family protein [Candidatus Pseudobacter hemicellulosilyticus]|uniref:TlpA disulfide reductase family protein n=1 Tax=Candidatus Pseudobacter hemicellulosilyticus TaxID=3121375 RepID=A0AAJ5WY41_9BACT|nr:MAG: TlpA disulfide reductase family protein [Pseudobacter sp.]
MNRMLLLFLLVPVVAVAQTTASFEIILPKHIQQDKLSISYDNGKGEKKVPASSDTIVIRDSLYSIKGSLQLSYPGSVPGQIVYRNFYFGPGPGQVNITGTDSADILRSIILKNMEDAAMQGMDQLNAFTKKEHDLTMEAYNKFMTAQSDSLFSIAQVLANKEMAQRLLFIANNGHYYYCFDQFKYYTNFTLIPVDSLIYIFKYAFPKEWQDSYQGKQLLHGLTVRSMREKVKMAPAFTVKDMDGKTCSLSQFRGRYVLINFWASWCVPCIKEMPDINRMTAGIPENELVKIYITQDKDLGDFEKAKEKYAIKGIHIMGNNELIRNYKAAAIPQLYLVDKEGKIIFDLEAGRVDGLVRLEAMLDGLWPRR